MYRMRKMSEALNLISLGKAHGYLTTSEINLYLEHLIPEQEYLQRICRALEKLNIEVIDRIRAAEDESYDICKDVTKEFGDALLALYTAWGEGRASLLPGQKQERVFRLRIGIEDGHIHSREDIAKKLGISVAQIDLIERKVCYRGRKNRRLKESID